MSRRTLEGPARRIAAAIAVVTVLVCVALGLTIWRYGEARAAGRQAAEAGYHQVLAERVRTAATTQDGLLHLYAVEKDPADLRRLRDAQRDVGRALDVLGGEVDPEERAAVRAMVASQERLDVFFAEQVAPVAGTPAFERVDAALDAAVIRLQRQVDALVREDGEEVAAENVAADDAADSARTVAIIAGLLAVLATLALGFYVIRLVSKLFDRIRDSATTLSVAAGEMLAGASEASTATNQQSAAVAEVAATVEELRATAVS
ncbi:MAG: hypothetical protein M3417_14860, partial [Actinomycetota bacterium]|nr:hypothetical protein [Actinomycetota bacterium]